MDSVALPEALPIHKDQRDNFHDLRECYISSELSTIEKQYEKNHQPANYIHRSTGRGSDTTVREQAY